MLVSELSPTVELSFLRCSFLRNVATRNGGAVYLPRGVTSASFESCAFQGNTAAKGGGDDVYVRYGVADGAVRMVDADVKIADVALHAGGRAGFEAENPRSFSQCGGGGGAGGSGEEEGACSSSPNARCLNRTTSFHPETTGRTFTNVALGRPILASSPAPGSLKETATMVDGAYNWDKRYFTHHLGNEVLPASASGSASSDVGDEGVWRNRSRSKAQRAWCSSIMWDKQACSARANSTPSILTMVV